MLLVIFVIVANLDNLLISLLYSLNNVKLNIKTFIIISTITTVGTWLSVILGKLIFNIIPIGYSIIISKIVLIIIGMYLVVSYFINSEKENFNVKKNLTLLDVILLGIILSINNIGVGIGFSINDFSFIKLLFFNFIFSYVFLILGVFLEKIIVFDSFKKIVVLLSGFLIMLMALI